MACPVKLKDVVLGGKGIGPPPPPPNPPLPPYCVMCVWAISPPPLSPDSQSGICNYRNEWDAGWLAGSRRRVCCHVPRPFFVCWVAVVGIAAPAAAITHTPTPAASHAEVTRLLGCQIDPASRAGGIGCSRGRSCFQDRSSAGAGARPVVCPTAAVHPSICATVLLR